MRWLRKSIDVTLMLSAPCNYDCSYCCVAEIKGKWQRDRFRSVLAARYLEFLDSFEAETKVVRISAYGELSIVPGIWDFIEALAQRPGVKVMLATNLTFAPEKLLKRVPPESFAFILTSLHPETELDLAGFTWRIKALRDHGYEVVTHFMVDDDRMEAARHHQQRMHEEGLPFFLSPMQGDFGAGMLPFCLGTKTKSFLKTEIEELHPQLLLRFEELAFTGLDCSAGHDRFCLRDTAISPCMNSNVVLGWVDDLPNFQPFAGSVPCPAVHARAQCLPDLFISECRSYCMGDHRLPGSSATVQHQIERFEKLWKQIVEPARMALGVAVADRIAAAVREVDGPVALALFGVSTWPLLGWVSELTRVETLVVTGGASAELRCLDPDDPAARELNPATVVVIHDAHGATAARRFVATLKGPASQVLDGLTNDVIELACRKAGTP